MNHEPLTRQRSRWVRQPLPPDLAWLASYGGAWWVRRVSDGTLRAIVAEEPAGWHLSVSFIDHRGELSRYPSWDEIAHARHELLPAEVDFVMWLPKAGEYVNVHPTTFHLHEHPQRSP